MQTGTLLGPYEIQAKLGEGGMGEVYKARDTRLDRTVAIKVLPAELSTDPDRRARFEREARAIAALSHPHICALFDIGEATASPPASGSVRVGEDAARQRDRLAPSAQPLAPGVPVHFLVMEHLSGQSLAERLLKGPLPLAQALELGAQIADALDAAHKHGIIHRDLKPGNVMLTSGGAGRSGVTVAKLLDFGLAKLAAHGERAAVAPGSKDPGLQGDAATPGHHAETAPTAPAPVTAEGTILGTLQYMAPEQLEGKEADARTDLWALGAILYEMVTGRRAFEGESQMSLAGNIMNAEPAALATLQPLTPPAFERVVTKCLAKHPDGRWDTAHDVADELRWIAQVSGTGAVADAVAGARTRRPRGLGLAAVGAGVMIGLAAGAGMMWMLRSTAPVVSLARLSVDVRPAEELNAGEGRSSHQFTAGGSRTAFTWTSDGQALVFVGRRNGVQQLYVRRLDGAEARPLAGTEGAQVRAVSRDGRWVAFWAANAIKKVPLGGGPVMDLAPGVTAPPRGLAWDEGGRVYFGHDDGRIWQVPPDGAPVALTMLGEAERSHGLPWPLPDGRAVLYTARRRAYSWGDEEVVAHTLATGARKVLLRDAADARYLHTGHLVFMRRGALFAVPFDAKQLEVRGPAVAVLDGVGQALTEGNARDITGAGQFAVAPAGILAWIPSPIVPYRDANLVTVDRRGKLTPLPAPVRSYFAAVRLSPDGRRIAVTIASLTERGLWLYDVGRETLTLLAGDVEASWPVWTPDGQRLAFLMLKDGRGSLALQPADGTAPPQDLLEAALMPSSWTPDGRHLVAATLGGDVVVVTVEGGTVSERPLLETPSHELDAEISPDGRWLAYRSDVSGRAEIYVRPYPGPGPAEQVSIAGGVNPAWNPAGKEIFFLSLPSPAGRRSMMAVEFQAGAPPRIGRPRALFESDPADLFAGGAVARLYDVAPDGQEFYVVQEHTPQSPPPVTHISLMPGFVEMLKAKVPAR